MSDAKIAVKVQVLLSGRAPHYRRLVAATFSDVKEAITRMYHRDSNDLIFEYRDEEGDLVQFDTDFEWEALVVQQQQQRLANASMDGTLSTPAARMVRIIVRSSDMDGPALLAAQQALAGLSSVAPSMASFLDCDAFGLTPSFSALGTAAASAAVPPTVASAVDAPGSRTSSAAPSRAPAAAPTADTPASAPSPAAPRGYTKRCPMCQSQLELHASRTWACDLCSHRSAPNGNETSLACRRCNFDMCLDCNNRLDAAAASGDSSVPPPQPRMLSPASGVGMILETVRDLMIGAHSHRRAQRGARHQDTSSAGETPADASQPAPSPPVASSSVQVSLPTAATTDATTQPDATGTCDATTQGSAAATADATTQQAAVTADATTQREAAAAAVTVDATTATAAAEPTAATTVQVEAAITEAPTPAVLPSSPTPAVTSPEVASPSSSSRLVVSPTLRTALRDLIPLLSLVYGIDAEKALTTCDGGKFRGAVRVQCDLHNGTVAYTLKDDDFIEHAFSRMVELVRLAAGPAPAASSDVPEHPLAVAEKIAAGLCGFYPALPTAHYNYAIILVKRNNLPQALSELEAAVSLGIDSAVVRADADLAVLQGEVRFRLLGVPVDAQTPEVKSLLELFNGLSAADARLALTRYGTVHRAVDVLLGSDGVLPLDAALNGNFAAPPQRPTGSLFSSLRR